jgi:hypothetical protein
MTDPIPFQHYRSKPLGKSGPPGHGQLPVRIPIGSPVVRSREEIYARRRALAQQQAELHHVPPPPAGPPDDPSPPCDALREISLELAVISAAMDATLAAARQDQVDDDEAQEREAAEREHRAAQRAQIAAQNEKVAMMASQVDQIVSLASDRCDREDALVAKIADLEILAADLDRQRNVARCLLRNADYVITNETDGDGVLAMMSESLASGVEPTAAMRQIVPWIKGQIAAGWDVDAWDLAVWLRDKALESLQPLM